MHRLIWAFAVRICSKTHFRMTKPLCCFVFVLFANSAVQIQIFFFRNFVNIVNVCEHPYLETVATIQGCNSNYHLQRLSSAAIVTLMPFLGIECVRLMSPLQNFIWAVSSEILPLSMCKMNVRAHIILRMRKVSLELLLSIDAFCCIQ